MGDAPWQGPTTLTMLYRDADVVVVDKPSGMLVHRGPASDRVVAMTITRNQVGQHVYPVHRLDRGTSGALVFALEPAGAGALQEQLRAGTVDKRYLALVRGVPPAEGVLDHPVPRAEDGERVPAVSAWRVLGSVSKPGRYSLVEVRPRTGRRHQIRRHLKHLAHPIIGDVRYGKGDHNRRFRAAPYGLHRLALHAWFLGFAHPRTGERIEVRAPLPADMATALAALGLPTGLPDE
jgi:tRNA pseudouridine65 synthase